MAHFKLINNWIYGDTVWILHLVTSQSCMGSSWSRCGVGVYPVYPVVWLWQYIQGMLASVRTCSSCLCLHPQLTDGLFHVLRLFYICCYLTTRKPDGAKSCTKQPVITDLVCDIPSCMPLCVYLCVPFSIQPGGNFSLTCQTSLKALIIICSCNTLQRQQLTID